MWIPEKPSRAASAKVVAGAFPKFWFLLGHLKPGVSMKEAEADLTVVAKRLVQARTLLDTSFPDPLPPDPAQAALETGRRVRALIDAYTEAARQVLGVDFLAIPAFTAHVEGVAELTAATVRRVA